MDLSEQRSESDEEREWGGGDLAVLEITFNDFLFLV